LLELLAGAEPVDAKVQQLEASAEQALGLCDEGILDIDLLREGPGIAERRDSSYAQV
jgi:hypothetical protein